VSSKRKRAPEDEPYVENYPPLRDWLRQHEARCNWQLPLGPKDAPVAYVESWWLGHGGEVLVVVQAQKMGWNLYTADGGNKVADAFIDAETRLGLWPKPVEDPALVEAARALERAHLAVGDAALELVRHVGKPPSGSGSGGKNMNILGCTYGDFYDAVAEWREAGEALARAMRDTGGKVPA
jgi:hypothetical protein